MNIEGLFKCQFNESKILYENINYLDVETFINKIFDTHCSNNSIYFCGVGKSENIGSHTADLLKSIGIKAFSLSPTNSLHGDLGVVRKNDLIVLYSNSGNTKELLESVIYFRKHECYIYGVFCNNNAKLIKYCDNVLILPVGKEIDGHFDLIPTTSFLNYTILANIIVSTCVYKMKLTLNLYGMNHPAGSIGKSALMLVEDMMNETNQYPLVDITCRLIDCMNELTIKKKNIILINKNDEAYAIMSDGDFRRLIIGSVNSNLISNMMIKSLEKINLNKEFEYIDNEKISLNQVKNIFTHKTLPVIKNNKFIGVLEI
jgi:arabinose-5-phosphate isomerase